METNFSPKEVVIGSIPMAPANDKWYKGKVHMAIVELKINVDTDDPIDAVYQAFLSIRHRDFWYSPNVGEARVKNNEGEFFVAPDWDQTEGPLVATPISTDGCHKYAYDKILWIKCFRKTTGASLAEAVMEYILLFGD